MATLNIKILDESMKELYEGVIAKYESQQTSSTQDSGIDVFAKEHIVVEPFKVSFIKTGIAARSSNLYLHFSQPYWLLPRSSISKTPLMMANSVGVIDSGYRGELMCAVRNMSNEAYNVERGTRLFQIVSNDMLPFKNVEIVEDLDDTSRGSGGFGSTGK
jgi:dUTP pyrophosphatase